MTLHCDLAIVGAGIVGVALAAALADSGLDIALVEAREPQPFDANAPLDLRVFAISRASEHLLRTVGAWETIAAARLCSYTGMEVWDSGGGRIEFHAADVGEPDLGHIVENRLLQSALLDRIAARGHVKTLWPRTCTGLSPEADAMALTLDNGETVCARLVVAADGAGSRLREWAGIEVFSHDYRQRAVVSHLTTEQRHRGVARQAFLDDGVLALLPLADGRVSLIWSTSAAHAEELLAMPEEDFCTAIAAASGYALGGVTAADRRASFPLLRMHAERYVRPRFALIGDAAHAVHPLAGQGVNLGLLDTAALAQTVADAAKRGRDIGVIGVLRRYERWRRSENAAMVWSLDGFQKLFSARPLPLRRARSTGLSTVDRLPVVKNAFMRRALGVSGDVPPLARRHEVIGNR